MKRIHHRIFIQANGLSPKELPEALADKIGIFDRVHSLLEETLDEHRKKLLKLLRKLDHELREDLEEAFEDRLAHNHFPEQKAPAPEKPDDKFEFFFRKNLGRTFLRSELLKMGISIPKGEKEIHHGKFKLVRTGIFTYRYRLTSTAQMK